MHDPSMDIVEFQVIGELKDDPGHLLLMGNDGGWYDYDIEGTIVLLEPSDSWAVDIVDDILRPFEIPNPKVA